MWRPKLRYRYEVSGTTHHGSQIHPHVDASSDDPKWAEKIGKDYPIDSAINVYVNPEDPEESALQWNPLLIASTVLATAVPAAGFIFIMILQEELR